VVWEGRPALLLPLLLAKRSLVLGGGQCCCPSARRAKPSADRHRPAPIPSAAASRQLGSAQLRARPPLPALVHVQVGLRFSSPTFTAGAIMQPRTSCLSELWAISRLRGWTLGMQLQPGCTPAELRQHLLGGAGSGLGMSSSSGAGAAAAGQGGTDKQVLQALAAAAGTPLPAAGAPGPRCAALLPQLLLPVFAACLLLAGRPAGRPT
jgi:hypothetical protein